MLVEGAWRRGFSRRSQTKSIFRIPRSSFVQSTPSQASVCSESLASTGVGLLFLSVRFSLSSRNFRHFLTTNLEALTNGSYCFIFLTKARKSVFSGELYRRYRRWFARLSRNGAAVVYKSKRCFYAEAD